MEEFLSIYKANPLLIVNQLLMLAAVIYACVCLGKHPGPSLCLIIASVLTFAGFLAWVIVFQVIEVGYDSVAYKIFRHTNSVTELASSVLLYIGVFGWRGRREEVRFERVAMAPTGPAPAAPLEGIPPVRIPRGWVTTLTILVAGGIPILTIALVAAAIAASETDPDSMIGLFVVLGIAMLGVVVISTVLVMEILYHAWKAIQDGHARTTPGRAVGFSFIPLFNLYWIFVAWSGLAKDFNAFLDRYQIPTRRLPEGLFMTYCVMVIVGIVASNIPFLGPFYSIAEAVIALVALWSVTGRANELYAYLTQTRGTSMSVS